jgi:transposase
MIPVGPATRIFLAAGPTDMRKSFEGLSDLVRSRLKGDPLSGHLFVFANRRKTRLKLLYFDGSGLWVCAKRMERGCVCWPALDSSEAARQIVAEELALILGGIDLEKTHRRPWWCKPSQESGKKVEAN